MPTDRNKVSAYLSDQDFTLLGELAAQNRVSKSQMVAIAIRYMSGESTPTNTVTNLTGNVPVENGVSEVTVGALVKSKLVELLSNPTEELKQKLDALFKEYVTNNGKVESLKETCQNSKGSEVTIETPRENNGSSVTVKSPSPVSEVMSNPTITAAADNHLTNPTIELQTTQNNSSENPLEDPLNEIQEQSPLEVAKPVTEANNEIRPESEETNTAETTTQTGIEDKKSKSTKLQKRTRLTKDELDHAIEVKDLEALLDLPLTEKLGKRKVVSHLKEKCNWVNTKLGDIKLNKLNTATADEIIREYCQR